MSRRRVTIDVRYTAEDLDYNKWPTVYFESRDEVFERRKRAVELYLDGVMSVKDITISTGIGRKELTAFVKKCLKKHDDGRLWGFRAILPYRRTGESYVRIADTDGFKNLTFTGAFKRLLEQYPNLVTLIRDYILNRRRRPVADRVIRIKDLRDKFLRLCLAEGITLNQYPFNTTDKCLRSLGRYVDWLTNEHPEEAGMRFGEEANRKLARFDGETSTQDRVVVPFQVVHLDGHKLDSLFSITFKNAYGDDVVEIMSRIWIILLMDEGTRAVLGHHLCLNKEYSAVDVLHCIKKAIVPWEPMNLTIPGLEYPQKPGYHSQAIQETAWALWSELKIDNAFANLANVVQDKLTRIVNCSVNPGAVKFPEARHIIERIFGKLEQDYFQRFSNTTGSNPKDPKRRNPEKAAKYYHIKAEEFEQLIEVAIADYNSKIHSTFGLSPLEVMEQRIRHRDMVPRILDENKRSEVNFFSLKDTRIIRGNKDSGKRPHINYEGAEYTSTILARNFGLIGTELTLEVNIEDISVIKVYLPDGQEFDYLRVRGPWGMKPHSLRTRKIINKLVREDKLRLDDRESPVDTLEKYYEEKAVKDKGVRNSLASLQRYNQEALKKDGAQLLEESDFHIDTDVPSNEAEYVPNNETGDLEHLRSILRTNC